MTYLEQLDEHQQALVKRHLQLVIEANEKTNLTRITSMEEAMVLHVEDSLSGLEEIHNAPEGLYGDLGSGAGYPGVPLAIATGRKTLLIDARQKKMAILDGIIADLGLSDQIATYSGRAELLARKRAGEFSVLTARALSKLPVLMELASPLLTRGGLLVCYKAQIEESELAHARRVQKSTGMVMTSGRDFKIGEFTRKIITFEKTSHPTVKFPRQEGQAQKHPLEN